MTETSHLAPTAPADVITPRMLPIPEGWFQMGSLAGQDNEQPLHRVWIDAFELAECQVTNAEYAKFLKATSHHPPPNWNDPNFSAPPATRRRTLLVRRRSLLRMAESNLRPCNRTQPPRKPQARTHTFSSADRSRMGTRRPRRPGTKAIPVGRRSPGNTP